MTVEIDHTTRYEVVECTNNTKTHTFVDATPICPGPFCETELPHHFDRYESKTITCPNCGTDYEFINLTVPLTITIEK